MARKYDLISELYNRTCKTVVSSPESWQAFLTSACRNYKLRFDEQLLVFAQRPDATAVLEIERWNKSFGRWVNRGAVGIAVFDDVRRSRQRLIHYFDISDTHASKNASPVPLWEMKPEYEQEVIETLENTFGQLVGGNDMMSAIFSAAHNAVEDNLPDYAQHSHLLGISFETNSVKAAYRNNSRSLGIFERYSGPLVKTNQQNFIVNFSLRVARPEWLTRTCEMIPNDTFGAPSREAHPRRTNIATAQRLDLDGRLCGGYNAVRDGNARSS